MLLAELLNAYNGANARKTAQQCAENGMRLCTERTRQSPGGALAHAR